VIADSYEDRNEAINEALNEASNFQRALLTALFRHFTGS
jgi:hypothetical protein